MEIQTNSWLRWSLPLILLLSACAETATDRPFGPGTVTKAPDAGDGGATRDAVGRDEGTASDGDLADRNSDAGLSDGAKRDGAADPDAAEPPASLIHYVDFDGYPAGTRYTEAVANELFNVTRHTSKFGGAFDDNSDQRDIQIVADPSGDPARGNALRIRRVDGQYKNLLSHYHHFSTAHYNIFPDPDGENVHNYPLSNEANGTTDTPGAPPYAAALERENDPRQKRYDEINFAIDLYFPDGTGADPRWEWLNYHKLIGIKSGTALQASHGPEPVANREGFYGLTTTISMTGTEWGRGIPPGALTFYRYDMGRTQKTQPFNRNDPTNNSSKTMSDEDFYIPPRGKWISLEIHWRLNTADDDYTTVNNSHDTDWAKKAAEELGLPTALLADAPSAGDLKDGLLEVWVQEEGWPVAKKMISYTGRWRAWNFLKITQTNLRSYVNDNDNTNPTNPTQTQYHYYDNYIVKQGPILPRP